MPIAIPSADEHAEIREAVRDLCARYDGEYWRAVDEKAAYPEEFANALTSAGWLAALVGLVLFWRSPLWGRSAKVVGTVAYLLPLIVALVFLLPVGTAHAATNADGIGVFVPATYDALWTLAVATPLWLVPVSVVLALVAGRRRQA